MRCLQFMMLCPEGSEGVTYALLSTISNLAGSVAYDVGTGLTLFFDVSNDALQAGDYSGILYLTVITRSDTQQSVIRCACMQFMYD